jgi:hypothetical protein
VTAHLHLLHLTHQDHVRETAEENKEDQEKTRKIEKKNNAVRDPIRVTEKEKASLIEIVNEAKNIEDENK